MRVEHALIRVLVQRARRAIVAVLTIPHRIALRRDVRILRLCVGSRIAELFDLSQRWNDFPSFGAYSHSIDGPNRTLDSVAYKADVLSAIKPSTDVGRRTPHLGRFSSHFTLRPLHVQHPARERCDSLGGRPDEEFDRSPREDAWALRGASGGRWPRRRLEEDDDDSSEFCMMCKGWQQPTSRKPNPRVRCVPRIGT